MTRPTPRKVLSKAKKVAVFGLQGAAAIRAAEAKKEFLPTLPDKRDSGCDADELSRERGTGWART